MQTSLYSHFTPHYTYLPSVELINVGLAANRGVAMRISVFYLQAGISLSHHRWTRAYSSQLCRASRTAELILEQNTMRDLPQLVKDVRVQEMVSILLKYTVNEYNVICVY